MFVYIKKNLNIGLILNYFLFLLDKCSIWEKRIVYLVSKDDYFEIYVWNGRNVIYVYFF